MHDIFIQCAQYNIYVSQLQSRTSPSGPDDSFVTTPDSEARGVYIDLALILPVISLIKDDSTSDSDTLQEFFETLTPSHLPHPSTVWMNESTRVPLVLELKPPPTRHPKDILTFLKQVTKLLGNAIEQTLDQDTA